MKRVLLIVIDGWTSRLFRPALDGNQLPFFRELADRGWVSFDCVSIFPSITPAATASIVTGRYPSGHGISGMSWWNPSTGDVSYYGDDVWTVLKRGTGDFMRDFLLRLNGERLQAPTLFQLVERHDKRAACFNHLIFKGDVAHDITHPWLLQWLPSVGEGVTVHGPSWLALGDFVSDTGRRVDADAPGGVFDRFGLDDEGTEAFLKDVPDAGALPDFTVAYFADYDFASHDDGPGDSLDVLRRLDERLSSIVTQWGGLDRVLDQTAIVMTADHSHSDVGGGDDAAIEMERLLSSYQCGNPASGWQQGDELLVCPNMRATEIFHRASESDFVRRLARDVLEDARVDHVIWREARGDGRDEFHVATADRGCLRFCTARDAGSAVLDEYGGRWELHGEGEALDLACKGSSVEYGAYPNALERIANGVDFPRVGRAWVTARPGYEFAERGQSVHHGAGSHGTLHELDSRVPLLVAGAPVPPLGGAKTRIVDAAPICAAILGIPFDIEPGASRR